MRTPINVLQLGSKGGSAHRNPEEMTNTALTVDNAFDNQEFSDWWDKVDAATRHDYCWDTGVMLGVLIGYFQEGMDPAEAAKVATDDYEQWQGELEMAIPSWDR